MRLPPDPPPKIGKELFGFAHRATARAETRNGLLCYHADCLRRGPRYHCRRTYDNSPNSVGNAFELFPIRSTKNQTLSYWTVYDFWCVEKLYHSYKALEEVIGAMMAWPIVAL